MTSTVLGCLTVNARTIHYRRFYLFQMICLPFIPILALFVQNLSIFLEQINAYEETRSVNQQVRADSKAIAKYFVSTKISIHSFFRFLSR